MVYIASDHAGLELKQQIIEHLKGIGQEVEDCGPFQYDAEDDYPDFCYPCAVKTAAEPGSLGIVIGGSGNGEAIVANKAIGVRAAVYYGSREEIVELARRHNNANVLSFGARFVTFEEVKRALHVFLKTPFDGGRHERRIRKVAEIERR